MLCLRAEVELEPEVRYWYFALSETEQARAAFRVDLLAREGPLLGEPHTRRLDGKLRELRFFLAGRPTSVSYRIAPRRRIIVLRVLTKTRRHERREVDRARHALQRCLDEQHTAEDDDE